MITIIKNEIQCKHCGEIIESKHIHDYKFCSCKKVAVDGGHECLMREYCSENPYDDFTELSITIEDEEVEWAT